MRSGTTLAVIGSMVVALAAAVGGCAEEQVAETPRIEEKVFAITPQTVPVKVDILEGSLSDLTVIERVNEDTGKVVYPPQLHGTLTLVNTSPDQAVSPLGGSIEFLDAAGQPIPLAEGRSDTSFQFASFSVERLDPGTETSREIDVPFPAAALEQRSLADLRVNVSYLRTPYRRQSTTIPATLDSAR
jgi:hypothetical protein